MASLDIDIVIVNWNSGPLLAACIQSLSGATASSVLVRSVCVVDNASSDGSLAFQWPDGLPWRVIQNTRNLGFAAACNQGAASGDAKFVLFLNPDTKLFSNSLSEPLRFLGDPANARYAICGIQLVDERNRPVSCVSRFPTTVDFISKALGLSLLFPHIFPSFTMPAGTPDKCGAVDQVMGAFMMVRRDVFAALGGLDERFFVYFEDLDFSLRVRSHGRASYFLKSASAYHRGHGSSEKVKGFRLYCSIRSRILFFNKHHRAVPALIVALFSLCLEPLSRLALALARWSLPDCRDILKGYMALYREVPNLFQDWARHRFGRFP